VPTSELGISVKEADGSASSEGNLLGWNSPVEKCNLSELLPDASGNDIPPKDGGWQDRITTYNLTEDSWLTANYYGSTWGWFGADFDCFEPGRAYFFKKVNSSYTWIQERDPRQ